MRKNINTSLTLLLIIGFNISLNAQSKKQQILSLESKIDSIYKLLEFERVENLKTKNNLNETIEKQNKTKIYDEEKKAELNTKLKQKNIENINLNLANKLLNETIFISRDSLNKQKLLSNNLIFSNELLNKRIIELKDSIKALQFNVEKLIIENSEAKKQPSKKLNSHLNLKVYNAQLSDYLVGDINPSDDYDPALEWLSQIGSSISSSTLSSQGKVNYRMSNISDLNTNTAWVEGETEYGIGVKLTFEMNFEKEFDNDPNAKFGAVYQIYGKFLMANGYCKTDVSWKSNSRVKQFIVYLNQEPLCIVNLLDKKQWQEFDISEILLKKDIKNRDKLIFEITDVYKGEKYKDTAITEFLGFTMGN